MTTTFYKLILKLAYVLVLSSGLVGLAQAHEVVPTIADVQSSDGQVTLDLRVNLEALMSGIDLDAVADTNDAEDASDYDSLRALPADEVAARAPELLAQWNALPLLRADGEPVALEAVALTLPEDVNPELPRIAEWSLQGMVPQDTRGLVVSWPDGSGALVRKAPKFCLRAADSNPRGRRLPAIFPSGLTTSCPKGWIISCSCWGCFSCRHICARWSGRSRRLRPRIR
jgi:hypothetical protein